MKTSKLLPFLVLFIVFGALAVETKYGVEVDLEQATPILLAIGVTGGAIKAIKSAASVKKELPEELKRQFSLMVQNAEDKIRGKP